MKTQIKMPSCYVLLALLMLLPGTIFGQQASDHDATSPAAASKSDPPETTAPVQSPDPAKTLWTQFKFNFEIGGQITDVSGERPSKFEEFRHVREGFLFRKFRISSNPEGSPGFFRLIGRSPSEIDQRFLLDFGSYGSFRTTVEYSELPHLYSRGSRTFYKYAGNGFLSVADDIQQSFNNAAVADLPTLVQSTLDARGFDINLRTRRRHIQWKQRLNLTDHLNLHWSFLNQRKSGNRPLGAGVYERTGISTGDTYRVLSMELPEPVEWHTNQVTAGVGYVTSKFGINFDYTFSKFNNRITNLIHDNPFRSIDLQATSGGNLNRMGSVRGIYSLSPDNESNAFMLSFYFNLPHNTRWASAIGWSYWRQNDTFAPFTLNTAVVASNLPAGTDLTNVSTLPRQSLEGAVDNFTNDHLFTTQLGSRFRVNLHYRSIDMDNTTRHILFPGYVANIESNWRPNISGVLIENTPYSYLRQTATAEGIIDLTDALSWQVEYKWEGWNRTNRQVARSTENAFGTMLNYRPNNKFNSRVSYDYSDRAPREYNSGVLEYIGLRMFDQAARVRNNINWQWQYFVRSDLGISGTFGYLNDDFDQNLFGMTKYAQGTGSIDLLYTGYENTTFYFNYARERYSSTMQTIAKTGAPWALQNRWNRDETDILDSVGLGLTTYLLEDKFFIDMHYAYSSGRTLINTNNPVTPLPGNILNALAFPFPDIKTKFSDFNADTNY